MGRGGGARVQAVPDASLLPRAQPSRRMGIHADPLCTLTCWHAGAMRPWRLDSGGQTHATALTWRSGRRAPPAVRCGICRAGRPCSCDHLPTQQSTHVLATQSTTAAPPPAAAVARAASVRVGMARVSPMTMPRRGPAAVVFLVSVSHAWLCDWLCCCGGVIGSRRPTPQHAAAAAGTPVSAHC